MRSTGQTHSTRRGAFVLVALVIILVGCQSDPSSDPASSTTARAAEAVTRSNGAPTLTSPTGSWTLGETTSLTLIAPPRAITLHVELALDETFQIVVYKKSVDVRAAVDSDVKSAGSGTPIRVTSDAELRPGETLHVRACAGFPDGDVGAWTESRFPVRLATPRILGEPTQSYAADIKPAIAWSAVHGASGYTVELYREGAGVKPIFDMAIKPSSTTRTLTPVPLSPGRYRVRVRGVMEDQLGDWSKERHFAVDSVACRISTPTNGAGVETRQPTIEWMPGSPHAESFEVELERLGPAGGADRTRHYDVAATSLSVPDRLEIGGRYRVRVRPVFGDAEVDGIDPDATTSAADWSAPVVFSIIASSEDLVPVELVALDPDYDAANPTVSANGAFLAYIERAVGSKALESDRSVADAGRESRDRVAILERVKGPKGPTFRRSNAADARFPGVNGVSGRLHHPSWGVNSDREAVLLVASAICASGAPASETRGALFRVERLGAGNRNLIPAVFQASILHPTVAPTTTSRVYFEAQDLSCIASPDASVIGEIWSMRADGKDLRLHGVGHDPVVAPDGKRLALIAPGSVGPEIHVRSLRSGSRQSGSVTSQKGQGKTVGEVERTLIAATSPADRFRGLSWSPDGSHLAFSRDSGDGFNVFVVNVKTGLEEQLTDSFTDDVDPAFVPDPIAKTNIAGVVFASRRSGKRQGIYLVRYRP